MHPFLPGRGACRAAPLLALLLVLLPLRAQGLTILREFADLSPPPDASQLHGGGDFQALFDAAADWWEDAIADDHTVQIFYRWSPLPGGTLGTSIYFNADADGRPTQAFLTIDNDSDYFMDPTPYEHSEFSVFDAYAQELGSPEGPVNVGRIHSGAQGDAALGYDMLSLIMHEIGHSLGLVVGAIFDADTAGDSDIDVTAPRPFAGASLPTTLDGGGHLSLGTALMYPYLGFGERALLSVADILGVAELNDFTELDLDPMPAPVPEPTTALLLGLGLTGLAALRKAPTR